MDTFFSLRLDELGAGQVDAAAAALVAIGTIYCFLGHRALKLVIGLTGFLVAGAVASALVGLLTDGHLVSVGIGFLVGGIAGAMALLFLYRLGIFLIGFLAVALIAHNVLPVRPEAWVPLAVAGSGVVGGVISLVVERPVVILATAAIGSWLLVSVGARFALATEYLAQENSPLNPDQIEWALLIAWSILAVMGAFAQFTTGRRGKARSES
ncbi:MAG: DUF4203 domain-containing protein [Candidatus Hydrogenedentes bacterium]|nr:DUF4203 domain-containing protein [Candidatus Hydrogenedentota bacterium]